MENNCIFISSRGILKSCSFHSKNPKSDCDNDSSYLYDMLNNQYENMSIYVCSKLLIYFIDKILPHINYKFVLVSGDSDSTVPDGLYENYKLLQLIETDKVVKWFCQNIIIEHSKVFQLPIGLDYHTIYINPNKNWRLEGEPTLPIHQEQILFNIKKMSKPFNDRKNKIYVNFTMADLWYQRKESIRIIPKELLEINNNFTPRTHNWEITSNYKFVLSPFGNGMDCHRTWEILCLGCIPIMKASQFKQMFEDLPVLNVNEWSDITDELLENTIKDFNKKVFNYDKLELNYWKSLINSK